VLTRKDMNSFALVRLEQMVRPLLVACSPRLAVRLYSQGRRRFLDVLKDEGLPNYDPPKRLERVLWGITHRGPLMWGAGVDKAGELYAVSYALGAGAHMVGTTTANARPGNLKEGVQCPFLPLPRSKGALNYLGLPNPSDAAVAEKIGEIGSTRTCPIWASTMASPDFKGKEQLDALVCGMRRYEAAGVDVLEINESCPNTDHDSSSLYERLEYVSKEFVRQSKVPVVVKFSNDTRREQVRGIVEMLVRLGFAGVNFGNSSKEYARHRKQVKQEERSAFDFFTGTFGGGYTGADLKADSLVLSSEAVVCRDLLKPGQEFHVVRTGGIECGHDLKYSELAGISMNHFVTGFFDRFPRDGYKVYKKVYREYERARRMYEQGWRDYGKSPKGW